MIQQLFDQLSNILRKVEEWSSLMHDFHSNSIKIIFKGTSEANMWWSSSMFLYNHEVQTNWKIIASNSFNIWKSTWKFEV
jgi:hypothetical protein